MRRRGDAAVAHGGAVPTIPHRDIPEVVAERLLVIAQWVFLAALAFSAWMGR